MRIETKELYPSKHVPELLAVAWKGHKSGRKPEALGPDNFPVYEDDPLRELHRLLNRFLEETAGEHAWMIEPGKQPSARKLLAGDSRWRSLAIQAVAARVVWSWKAPRWNKDWHGWAYEGNELESLHALLSALFQTKSDLSELETLQLTRLLTGPLGAEISAHVPPLGVVMAVERVFSGKPLAASVRKELIALLKLCIAQAVPKERAGESSRLWRELGASEAFAQMIDPNQAFKRLSAMLLDEATVRELVEQVRRPVEEMGHYIPQVGPISAFLDLLEAYLVDHPMLDAVREGLAAIEKSMDWGRVTKAQQKELGRIRALLGGPSTVEIEPGEAWANQARRDLQSLAPAQQQAWNRLLAHCTTAEASKPAKKWLALANELANAIGDAEFKQRVTAWFGLVALPRPVHREPAHPQWAPDPDLLITDRNATILKGLAWSCAGFSDPAISRALSELSEVCFKKVRWLGPRCPRVGNACLFSLTTMASEDAAAQLSKLDQLVKQPTARKMIGKSLDKAAELTGQTREDLEESTVPTFGLDEEGCLRQSFGGFQAEFRISGPRALELVWYKADGKPQKSVPAEVKEKHADEFKKFKRTLQDIEKMLPAHKSRIERLVISEREWALDQWRQRYLNHPLVATLARRLIWHFRLGDRTGLGIWHEGKLVDAKDAPLDWLAPETRVRLWHPIGFDAEVVLSWRRWLEEHRVVQPFKQAHREIYVITDAELSTGTYSNRFAAHIIKQHQFAALARQRGWKYGLMGGFDFQSTPTLALLRWNLSAEFWVEPTGNRDDQSDSGIALYLSTDQVRFLRDEEHPLPLHEVPALVFSEVMRDVDLFVGVCSIGNDPAWRDQGELEAGGAYWQNYSFGDLSASARTRHGVLERLLPKLRISNRCNLTDKFLVVKGSVRTYKIHLGSGNILMEPNDRYLCIVPDRGGAAAKSNEVFLPFEGDSTLSVILSKAFLLAEDAKIKDQTILNQIRAP